MIKPVIIIGGGLAGISSAIRYKEEGREVYIYDSKPNLGGLLGGIKLNGNEYPFGTHILRKSGISKIDNIIFPSEYNWEYLSYVKNGNITNIKLDTKTGFLNLAGLPIKVQICTYLHLLKSFLLHNFTNHENYRSTRLDEKLLRLYGNNLANYFNSISRHFFGIGTDTQKSNSLDPIVCTDRIKAFTPRSSRILKKLRFFDQRISFHSSSEGALKNSNFVPKNLSYRDWWICVASKLKDKGINIYTRSKCIIRPGNCLEVYTDGNKVKSWELKNVELVSTIGSEKIASHGVNTDLYFYESSEKPSVNSFFITSYSPHTIFSRVTLCANLGATHNGIVVETIRSANVKSVIEETSKKIIQQLLYYNIVSDNSVLKLVKHIDLGSGGFRPTLFAPIEESDPCNTQTKGIASGSSWFMSDVIND